MRRVITILIFVLLSTVVAQGQIKIGGNVYGGGNHANVDGGTKVTIKAGDIGAVLDPSVVNPLDDPQGKVFGGARMANVGGSAFVNIDGENATDFILINQVFGGNDIAGQIGTAKAVHEKIPTELTAVKAAGDADYTKNVVDSTFNCYVRISSKVWIQDGDTVKYTAEEIANASTDPDNPAYGKRTTDVKPDPDAKKIYIGQLFAGGNGDFDYDQEPDPEAGTVIHSIYNWSDKSHQYPIAQVTTDENDVGFQLPELHKTYLEIKGGSIVYGYGGGNNATVDTLNIIHFDNPSAVVNHILVDSTTGKEADDETYTTYETNITNGEENPVPSGYKELLTDNRFLEMGINTTFSFPSSGAFQVGRFFGGNNKAEMHIRPTWNLLAGKIRNLYSGGNKGKMTSSDGLLLEIKNYSSLIVDYLYGGCRMADVMPTVNGKYAPCTNLDGYNFPDQLSARVLVSGGHVNNVYGGNDVTGIVYGGNAVGIHTTVYGDVYGGGNGAYPYTDIPTMKDDLTYGDFYLGDNSSSIEDLNAYRPNAEQVSVRLAGTDAEHPTIIKGSVYVGGNCASLATKIVDPENPVEPRVELKIGSHVIADKVFLGNNGEKMVDSTLLALYKTISSFNLTDKSIFAEYMNGVAMPLKPTVLFDNTANGDAVNYIDNSSMIGSFYGGGNKGSMMISGKTSLKFDRKLIIFNKLVGGCNDANVEQGELNAAYEGGLLGSSDEWESYTENGNIKDRLQLDLENVLIEPRRWNDTFTAVPNGTTLTAGKEYYETNLHHTKFIAKGTEVSTTENPYYELSVVGLKLDWNTAIWNTDENDFLATDSTNTANDKIRRLVGGNVYGGCFNSGHVNGNVVININHDLLKKDVVFAEADSKDPYKMKEGGQRHSGVLRETQGDDVQSVAMTVFGAGKGEDTEIWGSTTVNHTNGYAFQIFGGGEEGVVGKHKVDGNGNPVLDDEGNYTYEYNARYSSTVNLNGGNAGYSEEVTNGLPIPETEYIYGGGCEGDVLGDSYVYLGNGRVYDAFGGASNADIYGGTEVHIGYNGGFPWVKDNVYGGNDFGGVIRGKINHTRATTRPVFDAQMLQSSTYVKYILGRVDSIFGGNYGSYDYADSVFKDYTYSRGEAGIPASLGPGAPRLDENNEPVFSFPYLSNNSFVHFVPADNSNNQVNFIFGGSEGFAGHHKLNNAMQTEAYALIDDTQTKDVNRFANVDIYGGGAFAGVGSTETSLGAGRTAIDLFAGSFHNIYGGCNQEGLVGYTRINVPAVSTAKVNALFGGGKGYDPALFKGDSVVLAERFCDHYVTCIDYKSKDAIVNDAIYGGNENSRIACDTYINVEAPVMQSSGYQATIYGAGYGKETVSGRTNVFMNNGSNAYKVFGGGRDGNAFNYASLTQWLINQFILAGTTSPTAIETKLKDYRQTLDDFGTYLVDYPIQLPNNTGTYPNAGVYDGTYTNDILPTEEKPMPDYHQTNVHIMNGGNVSGYAYGGGLGTDAVVSGTTFLELKGGNVDRDIYGGGQGGPVYDEFGLKTFTATTNVHIEGGMARNVYGGGYLGHVGKHYKTVLTEIVDAAIHETDAVDIPAIANVTIGKVDGTSFYDGIPAITRNVYGGGEGGSVYGNANLTINNGYIGYRYKTNETNGTYEEELDDQKPNDIELAGNAFGGGYVVNSYVDTTFVKMYGGTLRGSLYGGGEVGPIGRGTVRYKDTYSTGLVNGNARIYKGGKTHVQLYDGHVRRNVFGGGRGKDSWGGDGTMYMDEELKPSLDLQCKGYVFGQTEVEIYGGEVGTDDGVAQGYGNVFGAGDIGCVYSATGSKSGARYDDGKEGYYYDGENKLTEDCKVLVEPWCKANAAVTINGIDYAIGDFVPADTLNYLGNTIADTLIWAALGKEDVNKEGIIIHNAVFAGGNTSPGSTEVYANTNTVFGNATASVHDVYNRDLISIGRGRVGGLYGDGNLTLVDGYRELNITNYGTDFYHINPEITLDQYNALPNREAAYYEIRYKCLQQCTDKDGKTYTKEATITADEMLTVFEGVKVLVGKDSIPMINSQGKPLEAYWQENGVCSRYAGRPMNTIQRADFCGVFGSRMVMQGAQDRVPEVVDYTKYTINRVREVSLNKKVSKRSGDAGDAKNKEHGNYFGIYSVVNYLGALTSDVDFHNVRITDNTDSTTYKTMTDPYEDVAAKEYGTATFYDWKASFHEDRKRNNGTSHNKVALASGVYLELTSEKGTGKGLYEKDWGYITGVVELDLINVQPGIGGGYVYAKNEHGVRGDSGNDQTILTALNSGAITNKKFTYTTSDETKKAWETSGNFIHSTQTIIDDCYNIGDRYKGDVNPNGTGAMPAHYWYIKGAIYVYDQYISAYTGSPNAFSEAVSIPLTITSASHGKLTLLNVQPNYYAYYSNGNTNTKIEDGKKIIIRDVEYGLNDVINYWDYSQLTATEKKMFVRETYVTIAECMLGEDTIPAGQVFLPAEYTALKNQYPQVYHVAKEKDVAFEEVFRSSNNVSHNSGYILTYNIDNPNQWNTWYTPKDGSSLMGKVDSKGIESVTKSDYEDGPTYTPNATNMYGQNDYKVGSIIPKEEYTTYTAAYSQLTDDQKTALGTQATFNEAFIVTAEVLETENKENKELRLHKGATLSKEDYTPQQWTDIINSHSVDSAYVVTSTIQLSKTDFIYRNTYMSVAEKNTLYDRYKNGTAEDKKIAAEILKSIVPAYYCTEEGKYGGNYYQTGHNYRALAAYSAMSPEDRTKFDFNYDALDLLIDPTYGRAEAQKYQYDSAAATLEGAQANRATYSLSTSIDYTATYKGTESFTYLDDNNKIKTIKTDTILSRTEFERLPNEQYYWAPVTVTNNEKYYVVKETIVLGDTPYAAGQVISKGTYDGLNATDKTKVDTLTFTNTGDYYYCRESYTIDGTDGHAITSATGVTGATGGTYEKGNTVATGVVINNVTYNALTNRQKNFSFHGLAPTETSTLYVTRSSDIFDLSKEKIITVIYQYDYVESDMSGTHITPVSERHILNIHLDFKSGIPTVEDILPPDIILPGTALSMPEPYVTPGAYEITGGGWKLFDNVSDAESHINGVEYTNSIDPLYLYQNKYYLAYYTKTYLGETYSNHVPVSVANYHDLKKVMNDSLHHYYIDHKDVHETQKVEPKIYINDYKTDDPATSKNGLDLFKNLYDLSIGEPLTGHSPLNERVIGGKKLEFFLRTDIAHPETWTSIASGSKPCFQGTLHGDGHTISGLDNSLFDKLCGSIYNLGVTGSFNTAGIVNTGDGYVESCWVKTTATTPLTEKEDEKPYAIFGKPADGTGYYQVVNSYYYDGNNNLYNTTTTDSMTISGGNRGKSRAMSAKEFYNGTVAYNLNNFYLYKRYSDQEVKSGTKKQKYSYFTIDDNDSLVIQNNHYYKENPSLCSTGYEYQSDVIMYVEDRFADGDFRYAAGVIPTSEDERFYRWTETDPTEPTYNTEQNGFFPIWPDDYIFFGQKLTYGWAVAPHQEVPTAVVRNEGRLSKLSDANRVYRAPAYFRSKDMGVAYFNPDAYLAQKEKLTAEQIELSVTPREAYPGMTAIDFAGHYDTHTPEGPKHYELGLNGGKFYAPLLDDGGLSSIVNCDETRNLLAYAPAESSATGYANKSTYDVLTAYFTEPAFNDYYNIDKPTTYRTVANAISTNASIYGHLVMDGKIAKNDHLLVDKEDFNCPIAFQFNGDHRMWYQRLPEDHEYVDFTKGWQGISIPFEAELVTTDTKGEITHFYNTDDPDQTSKNGTGTKIGHEYWLREFKGITEESKLEDETTKYFAKASFLYPDATGNSKSANNTFLWDYYYKNSDVHNHKDKNKDTYQTYYETGRTYAGYPLLTAGKPYIIGFPGDTYYEFDLSGNFEAKNTAVAITKLGKQTISFVSAAGVHINVSDDETENGVQAQKSLDSTNKDYSFTFKPSYMNEELKTGTYSYALDTDGDSYDIVEGDPVKVSAFRPFFKITTKAKGASPSPRRAPQSIIFGNDYSSMDGELQDALDGSLEIYSKDHKIFTTSHLKEATTIRIINVAGVTFANYVLQPGETVETPIRVDGVYIVNKKKLLVR